MANYHAQKKTGGRGNKGKGMGGGVRMGGGGMWRRTVYGCVQLLSLSFLLPGGECFHIKKSSTVAESVYQIS